VSRAWAYRNQNRFLKIEFDITRFRKWRSRIPPGEYYAPFHRVIRPRCLACRWNGDLYLGNPLQQRPAQSLRHRSSDTPPICYLSGFIRLRFTILILELRVARHILTISLLSLVHLPTLNMRHSGILLSKATRLGEPVSHPLPHIQRNVRSQDHLRPSYPSWLFCHWPFVQSPYAVELTD